MALTNQVAQLPGFFKIRPGVIEDVGYIISKADADLGSVVLASGAKFSKEVADRVERSLPRGVKVTRFIVEEASEFEVLELNQLCREVSATLVFSVGGGSVIDVGKRLNKLFGVQNIVVPTVISNDGLLSPISVLRGQDGRRDSYPASVPGGAIIDTTIIKSAPQRYLLAAAGDVLSNLSASQDWLRLDLANDSQMQFNDLAYHLAFGTAESVINSAVVDLADDAFIENLVRCQIYSGLAMSLAGSSRPCSGAEHLISHSIDQLGLVSGILHGYQVGAISLFTLHLLGLRIEPAIQFAKKVGLRLDWRHLSERLTKHVSEVVAGARVVRVGRRTILDEYSDLEILRQCEVFARTYCHPRISAAKAG
jgi:glycerol-1-phosphate dehydrogenase [NAD(P)+]